MSRSDDERRDEREPRAEQSGEREAPRPPWRSAFDEEGERPPRAREPVVDVVREGSAPPNSEDATLGEREHGAPTSSAVTPPPPPAVAADRRGPLPRPRPQWNDEELTRPAAAAPEGSDERKATSPALAAGGQPPTPSPRPRLGDDAALPASWDERSPIPRPRREESETAFAPSGETAAPFRSTPSAPAVRPPSEQAPPSSNSSAATAASGPAVGTAAPSATPGQPAGAAAPPSTPLPDDTFFADLAAGAHAERDDDTERSYRDLVRQVDAYREQGYHLYGMVGYPKSGKTHALKALVHRLHGFDPTAREQFRRERAPGPTEAWPFYYAYTGSAGERWVFMDPGGELFARLRSNDWSHAEASTGMLHTIGHCKGLLLLLHLGRGHLDRGAAGFVAGMEEDEAERERAAQRAQEEIEFFDHFLLFARALAAERDGLAGLVRRAAEVGLDEALRPYRKAPPLEVPVAVLFTQADRLAEGRDFALGGGRYLAPQGGLVGVAPFVARHLPSLFTSVASHARRFRFDFVQSYVERPAPGGGVPLWSYGDEPLSVGLLPAIEFLERAAPGGGLGRRAIDARAALRLDRLLHPGRWRGVEIEL